MSKAHKTTKEKHKCLKCGLEFEFDIPYIFNGKKAYTTSHVECGVVYRGYLIIDQNLISEVVE